MEIQKEKNMENDMGTEITRGFMRTRVGLEALQKSILHYTPKYFCNKRKSGGNLKPLQFHQFRAPSFVAYDLDLVCCGICGVALFMEKSGKHARIPSWHKC